MILIMMLIIIGCLFVTRTVDVGRSRPGQCVVKRGDVCLLRLYEVQLVLCCGGQLCDPSGLLVHCLM